MNTFDSFLDITAFDALRFIYENGASSQAEAVARGGGDDASSSSARETSNGTTAHSDGVAGDTEGTDPRTSNVAQRLPNLWKVIETQMLMEGDSVEIRRGWRPRRSGCSVSRSTGTHTPSKPNTPVLPLGPDTTVAAAMDNRTESRAATSQVSAELVFKVFDRVVYDPAKAVQRYEDALMHFVLNSPLAPTVAPKLATDTPHGSENDESTSDESELSQRPTSPRAFGDPSYPADPSSLSSPRSPSSSPAAALRRERRMLLSRYETCCEVLGMMPLSTVLDRLAGLDGGAASSLDSSVREWPGFLSGSPTNRSSLTMPCAGASACERRAVEESDASRSESARDTEETGDAAALPLSSTFLPKEAQQQQQQRKPLPLCNTSGGSPAKPTCLTVPPVATMTSGSTSPRPSSSSASGVQSPLTGPQSSTVAARREGETGAADSSSSAVSGTPRPTSAPADVLTALVNAHAINLSDCDGLGRAECLIPLFGLLEGFPLATFIGLANVGLTDAGATVLALLAEAHLPNLRGLDISRNPQVTDLSASALHRLLRRRKSICAVSLEETSFSILARTAIEMRAKRNATEQESATSAGN